MGVAGEQGSGTKALETLLPLYPITTGLLVRILITGGAGFLGSHLCDALIAQGHRVVCMDNFITGRPENIAHLMGHERFSFVKYNVCDYLHMDGPLDAVMHFASS